MIRDYSTGVAECESRIVWGKRNHQRFGEALVGGLVVFKLELSGSQPSPKPSLSWMWTFQSSVGGVFWSGDVIETVLKAVAVIRHGVFSSS